MNCTTDCSRVTKEKLERRTGGLEGKGLRWSVDDPRFCYASLISNRENLQLQDLGSRHVDLGESELPNEWCDECQVACRDKHMCIDKFKLKACIKNRVVSTDT